jgi:hypothetical protein
MAELASARAHLVSHAVVARQAEADLAAAAAQRQAKERAKRARGLYFLGALKLAGGIAITGVGAYLLIAQPPELGEPASIGIGTPTVLLGLGMALVGAPSSFREGANVGVTPSWSVAAVGLPGGGFVGAGRAF